MSNKDLLIDLANQNNIDTEHNAEYLDWLRWQLHKSQEEDTQKKETDISATVKENDLSDSKQNII